jgi:hypothetical protein
MAHAPIVRRPACGEEFVITGPASAWRWKNTAKNQK